MRRAVVALVALLMMVLFPSPAVLGGGSVFDFERRYYLPGERAVGQTVYWVAAKDKALLERTFYAYLLGGSRWIHPPTIPENAVPLGPVSLKPLARISFTVPDVPPGNYTVALCDRPCRHSLVGDLMGGWITVAGSAEEIRLQKRIDGMEGRIDGLLARTGTRADRAVRRATEASRQVEALESRLEGRQDLLEASLSRLEGEQRGSLTALDRAGWVVALLALAAVALVSVRRGKVSSAAAPVPPARPVRLGGDDLRWRIEAIDEEERTPAGVR